MRETVPRSSRMCGVDQLDVEKMTHWVAVTTTRWCSLSAISVTRSLNCSSSCVSSSTLVTLRLVASVCLTSRGLQLTSRSRSWPKRMVPLPVAPATCVESAVHARLKTEPQFGCSREWLQPVLSHRRSMLNEPTAKYRPLGAHATEEIENSTAAELYSCRP